MVSATRLLQGEVTDSLIIEKKGASGWITFNDPAKHNAMSYDMWAGVPQALEVFEKDDEIRAVVLTGAGGKAFVSGANISQFDKLRSSEDAVAEYERVGEGAQMAIWHFLKPTIARIDGYCIGGGLGIALCCDVRIASEMSSFSIPAGKMGLGYRLSAIRNLVSAVGAANALDIFFTAKRFNAQEAHARGLIQYVTSKADLDKQLDEYLAMIAANAPLTLQAGKKMIRQFQQIGSDVDVEGMRKLVMGCFASEDYKEGRKAFAEKRAPVFKGK